MTLDVHFAGLCAFVPNTTPSGSPPTSWSVLLRNLQPGFSDVSKPISPHFATIQYPLEEFDIHQNGEPRGPDLVVSDPQQQELGVLRLQGFRVQFELPGADVFAFDQTPLSRKEEGPQNAAERRSGLWLPRMEGLLPRAGAVASNRELRLFEDNGYPNISRLSGHVLLRGGVLETSALAPPGNPRVANIWEFRNDEGEVETQAVAYQTTVRSGELTDDPLIRLTDPDNTTTMTPRVANTSVFLMNFEVEEIVNWAAPEPIDESTVDADFDLMYWLSQRHRDASRALPHFRRQVGDGGGGSLRRTCGGAHFQSFDEADNELLERWGG